MITGKANKKKQFILLQAKTGSKRPVLWVHMYFPKKIVHFVELQMWKKIYG